jgi:hypothetical protein
VKARKFKSNTGSPVSIFRPDHPDAIRVGSDEPYETQDRAEIDALKGSTEVDEVKEKK